MISPSSEIGSGVFDSSRRAPPINAFFSTTLWMSSSAGPTCATVTGPEPVAAVVSLKIERFRSGSRPIGVANSGFSVTVRSPFWNVTSNFTSSGIARPSEVPRR